MAMKQPRLSVNSGLLCEQKGRGKRCTTSTLIQSLWDEAKSLRQKILSTCFVKGIRDGTLEPTVFAGFMVQDSLFCQRFQQSLVLAASKSQDKLKTFLQEETKGYETYYKNLWQQLNICSSEGIELKKAIKSYADYQQSVAKDKDSVYFIFAMIATLKIWLMIGEQLGQCDHGIYTAWISENFNADNTRCQQLEEFVGAMEQLGSFDKEEASRVFSSCMTGECHFFESLE